MKRQSLYIGGALLATTALSTTAMAGTFIDNVATNNTPTTVLTAAALSAQVFPATGAENVTLGTSTFVINFSNDLTTTFDFEIESSNSNFSSATNAAVRPMHASATATLFDLATGSFSGCTVQVLTERILVEDCLRTDGSGGGTGGIDAIRVSNVSFNEANGLSTAGTSIALSGIVRGQSNNTFETLSSGNLVTSAAGFSTASAATSTITINNSATPPFSTIGTATTARLGTVKTTNTAVVSTDLSTAINTAAAATGGMEFTITHGVLTDSAVTTLQIPNNGTDVSSLVPSAFNGSVASINVAAASSVGSYDIVINFDGTTAINAWSAGTIDVTHTAGTSNLSAPPGVTAGALASLVRGGFSTQINTAQSTAGDGATLFQSLIRVVNNGAVAGTVTLSVRDDADGSLYGNFTTETIEPNSSIQVSMGTVEAGLGITAAGQYQIGVSGPISGYAQHVMFNSVDNLFVDLSGFRNATP